MIALIEKYLLYSQYQKIKDFSLSYKLFTHKNYMTLLFTEGKVDFFLSKAK